MPVPKKESITSNNDPFVCESASPTPSDQQAFHDHLRALTRNAVRVVIEEVMREDLTQFLGASWGECTSKRRGYRNGPYTRNLATSSGPVRPLQYRRPLLWTLHSQSCHIIGSSGKSSCSKRSKRKLSYPGRMTRYSRYEPEVAEGLTQMFVARVSTHKVGDVAQTLMGVAPSASPVSRLNHTLTEQFEAWRMRPLQAHWRIVYLDGVHFDVRHGDQTDATILLTALGVDVEGNKEVLALRACAEESKDGWMDVLQDLRTRGVIQVDLMVTDGHDGLLAAVSPLFTATVRQRCVVHKQRNVMNAIPKRESNTVAAELSGIWKAATKEEALIQLEAFKGKYRQRYPEAVRSLIEDEEHLLSFYAFPQVMHRYIRTTNAIESFCEQCATTHGPN